MREVPGSSRGFHRLPPKNQVDKEPLRIQKCRGRLRNQTSKPRAFPAGLHCTPVMWSSTPSQGVFGSEKAGSCSGLALTHPEQSLGGHLDAYLVTR